MFADNIGELLAESITFPLILPVAGSGVNVLVGVGVQVGIEVEVGMSVLVGEGVPSGAHASNNSRYKTTTHM